MMKIILKLISLILLCITYSLKAEIIPIYTLNTTEGAELYCTDDNIQLYLYGETYRGDILISKKYDMFEVVSNTDYYNVPYYAEDIEFKTVFKINKTYFIKSNKIISAISLDSFYYEDSNEELSIISTALNEAHQNNKCLLWSFEKLE